MRLIKIIFILIPVVLLTVRCEKPDTTSNVSKITYFPEFTMEGDSYIILQKGSDFVDPGVTATEGGEEITVEKTGAVDTSVPAVYVLDYEATNSDGYGGAVQRVVRVVDYGTEIINISGLYEGIRDNRGFGGDVTITKIAPGVFEVEDLFGGFYWKYLAYGDQYAANAIFTQNADGTFTASQGFVPGWGEEVYAESLTYTAATNQFKYTAVFETGFSFDVTLTLKE